MEEELVVISKSIVVPRNVNKSNPHVEKIHLTPWDLSRLRFGYLQRGLLFPKPDLKIETTISRLQASLSVALDRFYPLAGRLVKLKNNEDDTVSFFISCNGSGVEFVHAVAKNIELGDVLELSGSVPGSFSSFFPATGIKNYHGVSRSLLMVQVTEMKDGIFIGFGYNSTVADGGSIWKFFNVWSEICSKDPGSETFRRPICLKGWFFDGIDYPIHIPDPINMRGRVNPPLEAECFGNVSQTGIATVTVGELLDHGLGWAAEQINKMVRSQTRENAKAFAENWVKDIKIPVSVGSKDLVVTNSHEFDVYCNDFGWGKPIAARAGPPYLNGRFVVFRGPEEGSLDFQACLQPETMEKLVMDIDFKEYVRIV